MPLTPVGPNQTERKNRNREGFVPVPMCEAAPFRLPCQPNNVAVCMQPLLLANNGIATTGTYCRYPSLVGDMCADAPQVRSSMARGCGNEQLMF